MLKIGFRWTSESNITAMKNGLKGGKIVIMMLNSFTERKPQYIVIISQFSWDNHINVQMPEHLYDFRFSK